MKEGSKVCPERGHSSKPKVERLLISLETKLLISSETGKKATSTQEKCLSTGKFRKS